MHHTGQRGVTFHLNAERSAFEHAQRSCTEVAATVDGPAFAIQQRETHCFGAAFNERGNLLRCLS